MKITYDKYADAVYIYIRKGKVEKTVPVDESVVVDFDKQGSIIGIEILSVSRLGNMVKILEKAVKQGASVKIFAKSPTYITV